MIPARLRPRAPRNAEFVSLLESFLIAAVTTVLVIRTQLWLTHYPQLGGGGLHIAHLLYGGIFMAIAIGVLLMYLGRGPRRPAALLGGIGFGFFIDELGKFVTEDNNYFYQPAAGVIYLVFIAIFLDHQDARAGPRPVRRRARGSTAIYLAIDAAARAAVYEHDRHAAGGRAPAGRRRHPARAGRDAAPPPHGASTGCRRRRRAGTSAGPRARATSTCERRTGPGLRARC